MFNHVYRDSLIPISELGSNQKLNGRNKVNKRVEWRKK